MRRILFVVLLAIGALAVLLGGPVPWVSSTGCETTYTWSGYSKLNREHPSWPTGFIVPAGTVLAVSWQAFDGYSIGAVPSRVDQDQNAEQGYIAIGATARGDQLSTDIPDALDEGASSAWLGSAQGVWPGWAGTQTAGGELILWHASTVGVTDGTPSSFTFSQISIVLDVCASGGVTTSTLPAATTTSSTVAATTTTVASVPPATSLPASPGGGGTTSDWAALLASAALIAANVGFVGYQLKRRNDHDIGVEVAP